MFFSNSVQLKDVLSRGVTRLSQDTQWSGSCGQESDVCSSPASAGSGRKRLQEHLRSVLAQIL